ncbi:MULTISPECIES: CBS domain-containing protein [unclassified Mucilaginibacter]|uniref:CBS domain-containing protein n=1 Tax=unclassified Mucilaginibacter TaxID=2617802 RepID=UPI0009599414|nr:MULTISPECIES: CBS domain-containing protein [unclassified Mucilaginibacter]OJW17621.1 MAG: histidine kinase [Mucilaginibacter sp. 44-25]PAW92968.1 histidine kinase [Mucilaginibacter sp. MD40]PLW89568.1 MAG: CBS domain-containing protein [Mucilaginibacter sp.]HEK20945.1 CBS domain-containing protein [Bacteroidota bacterium]
MKSVKHILARKGSNVIAVAAETTVLNVLKLMADKNIGSVVVTQNGEYAGLVTERDYARKIILMGKHSDDTTAGEIMSNGLPHITPESSVDDCMLIMSERNIRYLPVFDREQRLCGIISINDVVYETIHSQKETIEQLHSYIQS